MICSLYRGGLGNQLFQVATGIYLAKCNNDEYIIDPNNFREIGQGQRIEEYLNTVFRNVSQGTSKYNHVYRHEGLSTKYKQIPYSPNICLDGYFQSELYFNDSREYFSDLFGFSSTERYNDYVCIHVRGGDQGPQSEYAVLTPSYFTNSIAKIRSISSSPDKLKYFVVTDDIKYANELLNGINFTHVNSSALDELRFMSKCKYCIISTSTFGWWGSYLGSSKTTIVPGMWKTNTTRFSPDIYRHDMIKIDCC